MTTSEKSPSDIFLVVAKNKVILRVNNNRFVCVLKFKGPGDDTQIISIIFLMAVSRKLEKWSWKSILNAI